MWTGADAGDGAAGQCGNCHGVKAARHTLFLSLALPLSPYLPFVLTPVWTLLWPLLGWYSACNGFRDDDNELLKLLVMLRSALSISLASGKHLIPGAGGMGGMASTFHWGQSELVLFNGWTTGTSAKYFGTIVAIIVTVFIKVGAERAR